MGIQDPRPSLEWKYYKNQGDTILTKSSKNPKKLLFFCINGDNMIDKRNEIQSWVSTNNHWNAAKKGFNENWRMRDSNRWA